MKKNMSKTAALIAGSLLLALAGCNSKPDVPEVTATITPAETAAETPKPTRVPRVTSSATPTSAPKPTQAAAPEPTATTAPTKTPESTASSDTLSDAVAALRSAGILLSEGETAEAPFVNRIEIEKAETLGSHYLVITFNGQKNNITASDLSFQTDAFDWNLLKATNGTLTVTDSVTALNREGKTVLVCQVAEYLRGTTAAIPKSSSNFSNLTSAINTADNYVSWQMDHGGWDKGVEDQAKRAWNGTEKKNKSSGWAAKDGTPLGTIDNDATYTQMQHIAAVYREVPEPKYQESVLKGLDFIFQLQTESGGLTQVYPKRGNYSDNATFNDNAMINVLYMLEDMLYHRYPFDSDIIPEEYLVKVEECINKAIDFILKSQIKVNGELTAWCAQHDPVTCEPVSARAYELASISGSESVPIIKFLMNQEQTPEITKAAEAALAWFKVTELKGIKYIRKASDNNYFVQDGTSSTWYRFYEIGTNEPIFCDRDGILKHNILEIGTERRHGYAWAGNWAEKLLDAYEKNGYKTGSISAAYGDTAVYVSGKIEP